MAVLRLPGPVMKLSDLIRDEVTGGASATKLMAMVAFLAATVIFLRVGWNATAGEGFAWVLLVYMGAAGGSQGASKIIGRKFGSKNGDGATKPGGA